MRRLAYERPQPFDKRSDLIEYFISPQRLLPKENDDTVGLLEIAFNTQLQQIRGHSISNANSPPAGLVLISRADAAKRRPYLFIAQSFL